VERGTRGTREARGAIMYVTYLSYVYNGMNAAVTDTSCTYA
jgi:hypothetical protein